MHDSMAMRRPQRKTGSRWPGIMALLPALVLAGPTMAQLRAAPQGLRGGSQRVVKTAAGCFTAKFPGPVMRRADVASENPFLQARKYLQWPAVSVDYMSTQTRVVRGGWSEAGVALAMLLPGKQVVVERLLEDELHLHFARYKDKVTAPIAVSTRSNGRSTARGEIVMTRTHLYRILAVGPTAHASSTFIASVVPRSC